MLFAGGFTDSRKPTAAQVEQFVGYRQAVEGYTGTEYQKFVPVSYKSQVVAGMIYKVTYDVGDGQTIEAKVFVPLPGTNAVPQVMDVTQINEGGPVMLLDGGFSESRLPSAAQFEQFVGFRQAVEGYTGTEYSKFVPLSYKQQVVAGMNYKVTYDVGNGQTIEAKVFVPLPYTNAAPQVMEVTKTSSQIDVHPTALATAIVEEPIVDPEETTNNGLPAQQGYTTGALPLVVFIIIFVVGIYMYRKNNEDRYNKQRSGTIDRQQSDMV